MKLNVLRGQAGPLPKSFLILTGAAPQFPLPKKIWGRPQVIRKLRASSHSCLATWSSWWRMGRILTISDLVLRTEGVGWVLMNWVSIMGGTYWGSVGLCDPWLWGQLMHMYVCMYIYIYTYIHNILIIISYIIIILIIIYIYIHIMFADVQWLTIFAKPNVGLV